MNGSGRSDGTAPLLAALRSGAGEEAARHREAWRLAGAAISDDVGQLLGRGAYLECVLEFVSTWLVRDGLISWRITYTSAGGPFHATVRFRNPSGMDASISSASDDSATRALLAAVLEAGQ